MLRKSSIYLAFLCILTWALSIYGVHQTLRLRLPLPPATPIISALLALLASTAHLLPQPTILLSRISSSSPSKRAPAASIFTALLMILALLSPAFLAALSASPLLSNAVLSCLASTHWSSLFQHKDAAAVRAIQGALRCCGFNSAHDRAWPFPSAHEGTDARTCERTAGFGGRSCGRLWERQIRVVAGVEVAAGVLLQVLLLSVAYVMFAAHRSDGVAWASSDEAVPRRGLLEPTGYSDVDAVIQEEEQRVHERANGRQMGPGDQADSYRDED